MSQSQRDGNGFPELFYDPTSEPCRAVHWFALEAGIALRIRPTWLGLDQHLSPAFLQVNPRHQVPALRDGEFCLSEAAAIMVYLADRSNMHARWIGATAQQRARTHQLLSWYHTNLRYKLTYDYLLPCFIEPYYLGTPQPDEDQRKLKRSLLRPMLEQLEILLEPQPFLGGVDIGIADCLYAPELFALDIDPQAAAILDRYASLNAWLGRLRMRPACRGTHAIWNAVFPLMRRKLKENPTGAPDLSWIDKLGASLPIVC